MKAVLLLLASLVGFTAAFGTSDIGVSDTELLMVLVQAAGRRRRVPIVIDTRTGEGQAATSSDRRRVIDRWEWMRPLGGGCSVERTAGRPVKDLCG